MRFEFQQRKIAQHAETPTSGFAVLPTCCGLVIIDEYQIETKKSAYDIDGSRRAGRTSLMKFAQKQLLRPVIKLLMIAVTMTAASS